MNKRVLMIVFSYYPADPRVRREAEAMIDAGCEVDVICLRDKGQTTRDTVNGVRVFRLPPQRCRGGKIRYIWEYLLFITLSLLKAGLLHMSRFYRIVHVHNMPDVLVCSALIPRILGAKLILDLHDPMPEVFMAKYGMDASHPVIRTLRFLEKWSIRVSSMVLTPNIAFRKLFISRGCPPGKIHIIMNSPQESIFQASDQSGVKKKNNSDAFVVMYHGTIVERNGLGVAVEAVGRLRDKIPNLLLEVYGSGDYVEQFQRRVAELKLENRVNYHGQVPAETIAAAILTADIGLIPNLPSIHWDHAMPTRLFEYLCMGKPAIAPNTKGIHDYFDDDQLNYFEPGDAASLEEVLLKVHADPLRREEVRQKGAEVYRRHRWELERQRLVELVNDLLR
jgi:glycosyltransferase involved in cell wall biosynthesis